MTTTAMPAEVLRGAYRVYGVDVIPVGEDEITLVMPGHVSPMRAVAAGQRVHLSITGERLCEDYGRTLAEALEVTRWSWAVIHDPVNCTECEPDTEPEDLCAACTYVRVEQDWWLSWGQTESTPGAFPVTVVEATS
jgi:hypothetical protein